MKCKILAILISVSLFAVLATPTSAQSAISEQEVHAIGVNAYLYFYPAISFDITRLYSTNVEPGKEPLKGPMNTFASAAAYPAGDNKFVVRVNFEDPPSCAASRAFLVPQAMMYRHAAGRLALRAFGVRQSACAIALRLKLRDVLVDNHETLLSSRPSPSRFQD